MSNQIDKVDIESHRQIQELAKEWVDLWNNKGAFANNLGRQTRLNNVIAQVSNLNSMEVAYFCCQVVWSLGNMPHIRKDSIMDCLLMFHNALRIASCS